MVRELTSVASDLIIGLVPGVLEVEGRMDRFLGKLWSDDGGQDIAEYAVMLAVILILVVGTIRLVGTNANNAFSSAASSIQ